MENIFEGAKFGDTFVTRNGKRAIYHKKPLYSKHYLMVEDLLEFVPYDNDGICLGDDEWDIISKYKEPVDEETLREKAYEWTSFVKEDNLTIKVLALECAMIGYRKAKEE